MDKTPESLTYSSYLKIPELISLQKRLSQPEAHDEMLFIIVHQTYELWFKQILFDLEALIKHVQKENLIGAFRLLDRIHEILKVLVQQMDVLETMTPVEFNQFRSNLNPASGFQSFQFREVEILSGADANQYKKLLELQPEWKSVIEKRLNGPTLRESFIELLEKRNLIKSRTTEEIEKALFDIYHESQLEPIHNLCEYLIRYDEQFSLWRFRHVQMVERMIGMKKGTGGSLGVQYLRSTLKQRFFPELWNSRTSMT